MDIGKDKLLHKWLDVIEAADAKGMTPELVMKFVRGMKVKTSNELNRNLMIGLSAYIGHDAKFKSPTDSIIKFIRSTDFKMMTKGVAVEKKFFTDERGVYVTKKTINKRLTAPEQRRFKFVENIYNTRWKKFKEQYLGIGIAGLGIMSILKKQLLKNKKRKTTKRV